MSAHKENLIYDAEDRAARSQKQQRATHLDRKLEEANRKRGSQEIKRVEKPWIIDVRMVEFS